MPNQKQIQKLEKEITRSVFLKEDVKKRLLSVLPKMDGHDIETLSALFGHADKRQESLVARMMEYDDTFLPRMKYFVKGEVRKFSAGKEKAGRKKEKPEEILKGLD
jgi:hypothetical protein